MDVLFSSKLTCQTFLCLTGATFAANICSAVVIALLGWLISRFILIPLRELRTAINDVQHTLITHASIYANPGFERMSDDYRSTGNDIKKVRANLVLKSGNVPKLAFFLTRIPSKEALDKVSALLTRLRNSLYRGSALENHGVANDISGLLLNKLKAWEVETVHRKSKKQTRQ